MKFASIVRGALMATMLTSGALYAQSRPALPADKKQEMVNLMQENKERLKLTADQEPKFDAISLRYFREFRDIKNGADGMTEKFNKIKDAQIRKDAEMKELLSDEQYQTYLQIQQERRDRMQGKR